MSKQIGGFEIVRRLEAHAGAASYVARNSTDGAPATVDVWAAETPDAQARFLERATAAAVLENNHVARILDFGIDGTTSCRIEEACDGETLETRLGEGGELPRETALAWLTQIARALEYAHGMGVIHGDLHPGMVTIRSDCTVRVRGFANPRATGEFLYRAPELLRGDAVNVRTDLFAFGVLLHRLLTYEPGGHQVLPRRIKSASSLQLGDLPAGFPRRLLPVLESCLHDDPAGRPGDFTSVRGALEAAVHDLNAARASLADVEFRGRVAGKDGDPPPSLEKVAAAIKRPSRSRFRRRWLTFATVAGSALWLGGTLWWSKGSPAVAGSDAPVAGPPAITEVERPGTAVTMPDPLPSDDVASPANGAVPAGAAPSRATPAQPASFGTGRLALAPAWHPEITVSVAGCEPVVLDRRRLFEVEAGVDHVLTFELATRDYQIREQVVTQVPAGRLLEVPVPLVRPGFLRVAPVEESARPVFVRVGDEAIGWTPIDGLQLPVGTHVLSLFKNPTWRPEERVDQQIRVRSRQETTVQFDLESEPPALTVDGQRIEYAPVDEEPAP